MRVPSLTTSLIRWGFTDATRAASLIQEGWLADLYAQDPDVLRAVGECPDPNLALLTLVRIHDNAEAPERDLLQRVLTQAGEPRERLLAVLGSSAALGDTLAHHPTDLSVVTGEEGAGILLESAQDLRATLLRAVQVDPTRPSRACRGRCSRARWTRCGGPTGVNCCASPRLT